MARLGLVYIVPCSSPRTSTAHVYPLLGRRLYLDCSEHWRSAKTYNGDPRGHKGATVVLRSDGLSHIIYWGIKRRFPPATICAGLGVISPSPRGR